MRARAGAGRPPSSARGDMDAVYQFKPHLRVTAVGGGLVFLTGEEQQFVLKGRLHEVVAPLIDGRRTVAELIEAAAGAATAPEVLYVVGLLRDRGYLVETTDGVAPEHAAFWAALGVAPGRAARVLPGTRVAVEAAGLDEAGPLARALADAGLSLAEGAGLRVVATRDYLDPALDGVAARGRRLGFAWLPVKLSGPSCWIGPLMQPGAGA